MARKSTSFVEGIIMIILLLAIAAAMTTSVFQYIDNFTNSFKDDQTVGAFANVFSLLLKIGWVVGIGLGAYGLIRRAV